MPISSDDNRHIDIPRVMLTAGRLLELPIIALSTACYYYHRFFSIESFEKHDEYLVAQGCLFLASKVEESIRHVRDIINVVYRLRYPSKPALQVNDTFWALKAEVHRYEQIVLRVLGFQMQVGHSHNYLLHIVRDLEGTEELAAISFYLLNDSLCTTVSLDFEPHIIACAAIYLAAELISEELGSEHGIEWYVKYGATRCQIEEIAVKILDIYAFVYEMERSKKRMLKISQSNILPTTTTTTTSSSSNSIMSPSHHITFSSSSSSDSKESKQKSYTYP